MFDVATPDIFRLNAFRVTGLRVNVTAREIARYADKVTMMEGLGQNLKGNANALGIEAIPTFDEIRRAIQRLKDPELRIVDEFFWFWPPQWDLGATDLAIEAIESGDTEFALKVWTDREADVTDGVVAIHNVAVYSHLRALDLENGFSKTTNGVGDKRAVVDKLWRDALKRWDILSTDDLFWSNFVGRIKQLDDPRLTTGVGRRMRKTLGCAIKRINAEIVVRYLESGRTDLAQFHLQLMRLAEHREDEFNRVAELVLGPASARLRQQLHRANEQASRVPTDGLNAARELMAQATPVLALFEFFLGKEKGAAKDLSDEIAIACNHLPVEYFKTTNDNKGCIQLLRAAMSFATSVETRRMLNRSLIALGEDRRPKELLPIYALLAEIDGSDSHPKVRLERFRREAGPTITDWHCRFQESSDYGDLLAAAAVVVRGISVAAWNKHGDLVTALEANAVVRYNYAKGPEITDLVMADMAALENQKRLPFWRKRGPRIKL